MHDREMISQQMKSHYEAVWSAGDAWELATSEFERERYAHQLAMLARAPYPRALEIGCGSGCFTRQLAGIAGELIAVDISAAAIEQARAQVPEHTAARVSFRIANIMDFDLAAAGPLDLVVLSETIYCLGWLYPFFEVAMLASNLLGAMRENGRLLLANTYGAEKDWLLRPPLINTYRDLFRNVGFELERESVFSGVKNGQPFEVLMSLFGAPTQAAPRQPGRA